GRNCLLCVSPPPPFPTTNLCPELESRRVDQHDVDFPSAFLNLAQPPKAVWVAGALAIASPPAVAIVGTRHATAYGLRIARAIAITCARAGVCVVSGLARGIDGAAHEGALEAGGRTVAVLGTNLGVSYPRQHQALQLRIARDGLLITEAKPGEGIHAGTFPRRNRLIAALSQLVVVVEAGPKSGAQLTVSHAHTLGLRVAAVPGLIDSPQAYGTNRLLRDGADVIAEPDDVLALLNIDASPVAKPFLSGDDAGVWDALTAGAADIPTLARRAGISTRNAAGAVSALEIAGLVHVDVLGNVQSSAGSAKC
ncbi:MAG: DNA-processing protein DprA, partial [Gemmatimonadota bacterium]|nr:DNA-processing protein DprA [Gemmatimonadota bacterium]